MVIGIILLILLVMFVAGCIGAGLSGDAFGFFAGVLIVFQGTLLGGVIFVAAHFISKFW